MLVAATFAALSLTLAGSPQAAEAQSGSFWGTDGCLYQQNGGQLQRVECQAYDATLGTTVAQNAQGTFVLHNGRWLTEQDYIRIRTNSAPRPAQRTCSNGNRPGVYRQFEFGLFFTDAKCRDWVSPSGSRNGPWEDADIWVANQIVLGRIGTDIIRDARIRDNKKWEEERTRAAEERRLERKRLDRSAEERRLEQKRLDRAAEERRGVQNQMDRAAEERRRVQNQMDRAAEERRRRGW
jgi:hypothetical protein